MIDERIIDITRLKQKVSGLSQRDRIDVLALCVFAVLQASGEDDVADQVIQSVLDARDGNIEKLINNYYVADKIFLARGPWKGAKRLRWFAERMPMAGTEN